MTATLAPPDPATVTPPRAVPAILPAPPDEPLYGGLAGLRRFTVTEYHAMIRAGVLAEGERVELLNGFVVTQMSRGPEHDTAVYVLTRRLVRAVPDGWQARSQLGTTLPDDNEPEPDVMIARGGEMAYAARQPGPADAALVIEVSDSSLRRDTREKLAIYAATGVPEYWVVNVPDRRVQVYTQPAGDGYAARQDYALGQSVPVTLDGQAVLAIPVADLFPPPEAA